MNVNYTLLRCGAQENSLTLFDKIKDMGHQTAKRMLVTIRWFNGHEKSVAELDVRVGCNSFLFVCFCLFVLHIPRHFDKGLSVQINRRKIHETNLKGELHSIQLKPYHVSFS